MLQTTSRFVSKRWTFAGAAALTLAAGNAAAQEEPGPDPSEVPSEVPAEALELRPTPTARVHIVSWRRSFLYRRAEGASDFVTACEAPCDLELPIGDTYMIGGTGIKTTSEFKLAARPGDIVTIDVDGTNWVGVTGGSVLVWAGTYCFVVGILVTLVSLVPCPGCSGSPSSHEKQHLSLLAAGLGAALIAAGWLTVHISTQTSVSQRSTLPEPPPAAFARAPTWRTGVAADAAPAQFPLLFERSF